jgi:hypothetical protein
MEGIALRMGGIVVGGLLGAAIALYFGRTNRSVGMAGLNSTGQTIDNIVNQVRQRFMDPDKRSYFGNTSINQVHQTGPDDALNQVNKFINQDPQLKQDVNEIFKENKDTNSMQ